MRAPAPPYAHEGLPALWHVSEDPAIARFEPHVSATAAESEALVWAVDARHLPFYWFPRQCPRGTFWGSTATAPEDAERLLGGALRVHAIEEAWSGRMRTAVVFAYRLPEQPFEPHPEVGGYWIARVPIQPLAVEPLEDLVGLHEGAGIELRVLQNLWPLWNEVTGSALEYSGMRLRNARPPT